MAEETRGERLAWVRDLVAPLIVTAFLSGLQALAPHYADQLGWFGDAIAWRWTPTVVFTALAVVAIVVRATRPKPSPSVFHPDPLAGIWVESDGIKWVFDGWARWNEFSQAPIMRAECLEHGIELAYVVTGKGEVLQPFQKAGRFSGARYLYCVGVEGNSGHAFRPNFSKDMNSARIRADSRMRDKIRRSRPPNQSGPYMEH